MTRGETGRYLVTSTGGEQVRAFVPAPLPPVPALDLAALLGPMEAAQLALGRLQGISSLLPDPLLFLYTYVRKEALLSSQIEGTQSSIQELLLFELLLFEQPERPGVPTDDVVEVSNYVAALEHGLRRMDAGFPLSNRLLREVHGRLMASGRGSDQDPGHFRRSQNWIGGTRPGNAAFVPPPTQEVANCMSDLERFFHAPVPGVSELLRAGVAHVQFETIHPFLDGNGRLGAPTDHLPAVPPQGSERAAALSEPPFQAAAPELLRIARCRAAHRGLGGVVAVLSRRGGTDRGGGGFHRAPVAVPVPGRRGSDSTSGPAAGSALRVHQALKERPIGSVREAAAHAKLSIPAAANAMRTLEHAGIVRELTGRKRNRLFSYDRYVNIISEGT